MVYACLGAFVGYMLRIEPGLWIFSVGLVNLPFYAMEIRHHYCKDLVMIVGDIGPVEVELIYTIILVVSGGYFGGDAFEKTLAQVTGLNYGLLEGLKMKTLFAMLSFFLEIIFTYDNVKDSLEKNPKETMKFFIPVFIMVGLSFVSGQLPSFVSHTCIVYFLYQMVFAIIIVRLMIFNMAEKPFSILHVQYIYLLIPIIAYFVVGVSVELEAMITISSMLCSLFEFFFTIYRIAKQYTTLQNINFFTIKEKQ